jgi:hypothetical protein
MIFVFGLLGAYGNIMGHVDPLGIVKNTELRCWGTKLKAKVEYFLYVYFGI